MTVLLLVALVLVCLLADYVVQVRQAKVAAKAGVRIARPISILEYFLPEGVFLAPGHLWSLMSSNGRMKMGVDPFILKSFGKVDQVVLAEKGTKINRGQVFATLKQGQREIPLRAPFEGTIEDVNSPIEENPTQLKSVPERSWMVAMKPAHLSASMKMLMLGEDAKNWIEGEVRRFREFLASNALQPAYATTLQDGGLPAEGVLQIVTDETFEKFQNEFLAPKA